MHIESNINPEILPILAMTDIFVFNPDIDHVSNYVNTSRLKHDHLREIHKLEAMKHHDPNFDSEKKILTSSADRPAILAEHGASFCFIALTIDPLSNATLLHYHSPGYRKHVIGPYKTRIRTFSTPSLTLIGGMVEQDIKDIDNLRILNEELSPHTLPLRLLISDNNEILITQPSLHSTPNTSGPRGIIFIPKDISTTGKNTILTTSLSRDESSQAFYQAVDLSTKL